MYDTILVPVALDHSTHIERALDVARALKSDHGKIILAHAIEPIPGYIAMELPDGQLAANREQAKTSLESVVDGADDIEKVLIYGSAGRAILDYADKCDATLIVIASHKPGLQDYFLGSTAARVVRHAQCAVHVVR